MWVLVAPMGMQYNQIKTPDSGWPERVRRWRADLRGMGLDPEPLLFRWFAGTAAHHGPSSGRCGGENEPRRPALLRSYRRGLYPLRLASEFSGRILQWFSTAPVMGAGSACGRRPIRAKGPAGGGDDGVCELSRGMDRHYWLM